MLGIVEEKRLQNIFWTFGNCLENTLRDFTLEKRRYSAKAVEPALGDAIGQGHRG